MILLSNNALSFRPMFRTMLIWLFLAHVICDSMGFETNNENNYEKNANVLLKYAKRLARIYGLSRWL